MVLGRARFARFDWGRGFCAAFQGHENVDGNTYLGRVLWACPPSAVPRRMKPPIGEALSDKYADLLARARRYELALIQVAGCGGCTLCRDKARAALSFRGRTEKAETEQWA